EEPGPEAPAEEPEEPPAPPAAPALTVDQERLLRQLFAARLSLARERGLAPRRIADDDALTRLARGVSSEAALEGVEKRDAGVFLAVLARSRGS
ncbi:MAG: HRDC domain-containing protein, partial [Methylocystis sp.]